MGDSLRRITPAEVVEAYRETGLKPSREIWLGMLATPEGVSECGCALSAVVIADCDEAGREYFRKPFVSTPRVALRFGFDRDYAAGFVEGFDDVRYPGICNPTPARSIGHEDGVAAATAVFGSPVP